MARSTNKHKLKTEYDKLLPLATRFCIAMKEQLEQLITSNGLSLGVPLECRVKTFESAMAKIKAQPKAADSILALDDFIGFRLILLFKRDLDKTHQVIFDSFRVSAHEDTAERLQETEFGYQSRHYQINLPPEWMSVPTYNQFSDLRAEIQVRTLAQHIWAAASHKLQYKAEETVPPALRRAIYRTSALLEMVDLELDRVLDARQSYIEGIDIRKEDETLNVDLLKTILDTYLPKANKTEADEKYSHLVEDLVALNINSVGMLKDLIKENLDAALREDKKTAAEYHQDEDSGDEEGLERAKRGVYFNHTGLTRLLLGIKFGNRWLQYWNSEQARRRIFD